MTPIEIITGTNGQKILTGNTETDLSALNVVAIVGRSAGATFAKLEVAETDVVSAKGLTGETYDNSDIPLLAGKNHGTKTTLTFNKVQLTNATDSIWLIFGND